jgi:hypothetical protein
MSRPSLLLPSTLVIAGAAMFPGTAHAQSAKPELHVDVATHAMPGMPGMGALGRMAGAVGGFQPSYGMARHPGMPGRYLDVALYNPRQPGTTAYQDVPKGLKLGERIDLLASTRDPAADEAPATQNTPTPADGGPYKIRYYWGCGDTAGAGQPLTYTLSLRNGKPVQAGKAPAPRKTAAMDFQAGDGQVLWPNPSSRKSVSDKASLVGAHRVTDGGLAQPMQFELARDHDFMPALAPRMEGKAADGPTLRWDEVAGARAYFIHATAMDGDTIVLWSSSRDAYAGPELLDFLTDAEIAQWTGKRTLLGADARECRIPGEVFAGLGKAEPMLQMTAHGGGRSIATAAGTVHVRNKSTATLVPGMAAAGTESAKESTKESVKDSAKDEIKDAAKSMLRGLLRR